MSRASLLAALSRIAVRRRLDADARYYADALGIIESIAHELAHRIEMGRGWERRLDGVSDAAANRHEAATLRIEVAALSALGVKLSLRRLWWSANWRGKAPAFSDVRRPLTQRERRCVRELVGMVRKARHG